MQNSHAFLAHNFSILYHNFDLRSCEFSALIRSGQLTKEEAKVQIKVPKPVDQDIIEEVKTRLEFSDEEWDAMLKAPKKHFTDYTTYKKTFERLRPLFFILYKKGFVTKSFYTKFCFPQTFNR